MKGDGNVEPEATKKAWNNCWIMSITTKDGNPVRITAGGPQKLMLFPLDAFRLKHFPLSTLLKMHNANPSRYTFNDFTDIRALEPVNRGSYKASFKFNLTVDLWDDVKDFLKKKGIPFQYYQGICLVVANVELLLLIAARDTIYILSNFGWNSGDPHFHLLKPVFQLKLNKKGPFGFLGTALAGDDKRFGRFVLPFKAQVTTIFADEVTRFELWWEDQLDNLLSLHHTSNAITDDEALGELLEQWAGDVAEAEEEEDDGGI